MNINRIAALAATSALLLSVGSAMAATAPVTVKWNTQKSAAITLYTQTTASTVHTVPAANDVFWAGGASISSGCEGTVATASAGKDPGAAGTVDFGNVVPDGTLYTNCLEINAVEALVTTNDGAGVLTQAAITGTPVGYDTAANGSLICVLPDGTWNTGSATSWTASARVAAVAMSSTTACTTGTAMTSSLTTLLNSTVAATQDLNSDLQLNLGPNSTVGAVTATLTYTVTPN